jgi:hypothetical protein
MNGLQAAGFANIASEAEGLQLAGFLKCGRAESKGMQLGFINVADTIDGIPIGFISFVRPKADIKSLNCQAGML